MNHGRADLALPTENTMESGSAYCAVFARNWSIGSCTQVHIVLLDLFQIEPIRRLTRGDRRRQDDEL